MTADLNEDTCDLRLLDDGEAEGWTPPSVTFPAGAASQQESEENQIRALLDDARREGLELGRAEGLREYKQKQAELQELIKALARPLDGLDERVEQQLAQLALGIGQQLSAHRLQQHPEDIIDIVKAGLELLPVSSEPTRIKLNPKDASILKEAGALDQRIELLEDAAIARGGCLLQSGSSTVDRSVNARLLQVVSQLFGEGAENSHHGEPE